MHSILIFFSRGYGGTVLNAVTICRETRPRNHDLFPDKKMFLLFRGIGQPVPARPISSCCSYWSALCSKDKITDHHGPGGQEGKEDEPRHGDEDQLFLKVGDHLRHGRWSLQSLEQAGPHARDAPCKE